MEKKLQLKGVNKFYKLSNKETFHALYDVNVDFEKGELVSIVGESGSGKSTLMNLIGGLDSDFSGQIIADGEHLENLTDKELDKYRKNKVGFVFQSFNLIPHLSILDNVTLALTLSNVSEKEKVERATKMLKLVGLESQIKKSPNQLSGGQKQRVAIARALINDPEIIIADEPTGALDSDTSMQILDILKDIADRGKLVIMVTHSEKIASISSRVVEISDGKIINDHKNANYKKKKIKKEDKVEQPQQDAVTSNETKKKRNIKDRQNLSFVSAIRLSLHNMWASRIKNFLMAFGVAIGIGSLILMLCFSSGITDFITDTMKSYSDPTIATVSLKSKDAVDGEMGNMFSSFSFNQFEEEDIDELKKKMNTYLELEKYDYRVTDDKISYGMQLMTLDMQGALPGSNLIYINDGHKDDMIGKELFTQDVKNEETGEIKKVNPLEEYKKNGWIEYEKIYCLYTTPPYYSNTNIIAGKMSTNGKDSKDGKGGIMLTQGIKNLFPDLEYDEIVGKEVTVTLNLPSSITHGAPVQIKITDKITGIMDTSLMSGWMVCYIDYEYLGSILNGTEFNNGVMNASDFYKPTHLYIKTDSEEITASINKWLKTQDNYSGSIEDQFANMFENMTSVIGPSLIVISCISLVVSAMMILVVLYMSVSERTKEIGVLKSIGARRKDIRRIFTSESFLIGLLSGIFGIIFNLILTLIIMLVLTNTIGMCPISYRWWYFFLAVGVSIIISMLAGLYPANKASKLDPVESLRRE